jgi:LCP family protein required for cell wall assembly
VEPSVKKIWFALLLTGSLCLVAQASLVPAAAVPAPVRDDVVRAETTTLDTFPAQSTVTPALPAPVPMGPGVFHIILLGTDRRPPDNGWRTDTMILISVDPDQGIVSMVSIPRDLYVAIPGHGKTRLNLADNFGEADGYPGGGPALLKKMLEENLGLTFDRYVRIDFQGFTEMIDLLGGIDVDVACPTELWVPNMKAPGEYLLLRRLPAEMTHMDGELALIYCRCRTHTPVFDRDRRQREVLLAIRSRVLELGLPGLLTRLFPLLDSMRDHVQTDLEPGEMVYLAHLIADLPLSGISQRVIDLTVAPEWVTNDGAWVMRPDRALVKELMAERMVPLSEEEERLEAEGARISVENGTTVEGFGSQIANRLRARGFDVVEVGKSDRLDYAKTIIVSYDGESFTLERLRQYLRVDEENVHYEDDWLSEVAIKVIVGTDAQPPCP